MQKKSFFPVRIIGLIFIAVVVIASTANPMVYGADFDTNLRVDGISDLTTAVTGGGYPNSMIYIMTTGDAEIAKGFADGTGRFQISIPKQRPGNRLVVYAATEIFTDGQIDFEPYGVREIEVEDMTPPPAPSVKQLKKNGSGISGKAEKQSMVFVYIEGYLVVSKKVNSAGKYSIELPFLMKGMKVEVMAVDKGGRFSPPTMIFAK